MSAEIKSETINHVSIESWHRWIDISSKPRKVLWEFQSEHWTASKNCRGYSFAGNAMKNVFLGGINLRSAHNAYKHIYLANKYCQFNANFTDSHVPNISNCMPKVCYTDQYFVCMNMRRYTPSFTPMFLVIQAVSHIHSY